MITRGSGGLDGAAPWDASEAGGEPRHSCSTCTDDTASPPRRLILLGDSIAGGLGSRASRYGDIGAAKFGWKLADHSASGSTIAESLARFRENPVQGCAVLVAHGITEPILPPDPAHLRWAPPRWRCLGWMDPRAYYSSNVWRRILQRVESELRWRTKTVTMKFGTIQLMSQEAYCVAYTELCDLFEGDNTPVFTLEPTHIDERFFLGSSHEQALYWTSIKPAVRHHVLLCDEFEPWSDYLLDHFRPNSKGYEFIAARVIRVMREVLV